MSSASPSNLHSIPTTASSGPATGTKRCVVVGCGALGTSFCKQFLALPEFDTWSVTALTKTTDHHDSIRSEVDCPDSTRFQVLKWDDCPSDTLFDSVLFCGPPYGFDDFPAAIERAATTLWAGPSKGGFFIYTSSGGIYGCGVDNEIITETSPTADPKISARVERLSQAEELCRKHGGCCLRLGGLYSLDRGTHVWMLQAKPETRSTIDPSLLINHLHYDDAARACIAAMRQGPDVIQGRNFLLSDGNPMNRPDICAAALKLKHFQEQFDTPQFTGAKTQDGKIYDGSWTNKALQWKPQYASFEEFISSLC